MEHTLLTPHNIILSGEGIPYRLLYHLVEGSRGSGHSYHDGNLASNYYGYDDDIKEINEIEKSLGKLSPEHRDLRVMADFCCIWRYDYPRRVHEMCAAIGGSPHTAFGLHYQICPRQRQELIFYSEALKMWLNNGTSLKHNTIAPESERTFNKVYQMLGERDHLKDLLVERTYLGLSSRALNCSYWGYNNRGKVALAPYSAQELPSDWHKRMSAIERTIAKEMGNKARDFLCDVGGSAEPACHFKFIRRIDILVSSIGCLRWRGNLPAKDNTISGRRTITAIYLSILDKYWRGEASEYRESAGEDAATIEKELFELLGERNNFKCWLVASLWKNIKNQTQFHAFPMKRWVEFVRIGEDYLNKKMRQ
jgi:hypothetical protein